MDEICFPGCPRRVEHYRDESQKQLEYEIAAPFPCQNRQNIRSFEDCKKRPAFISKDEIKAYVERGFVNFKLVGRGLPQQMVEDSYIYYLVKEEKQEYIRDCIHKRLQELAQARKNIRK